MGENESKQFRPNGYTPCHWPDNEVPKRKLLNNETQKILSESRQAIATRLKTLSISLLLTPNLKQYFPEDILQFMPWAQVEGNMMHDHEQEKFGA